MIINKFGGASVKDAASVKRMGQICRDHIKCGVVVVSAMGKMTNLLEKITFNYINRIDTVDIFNEFVAYHHLIIDNLFSEPSKIKLKVNKHFEVLSKKLEIKPGMNYDFEYDQIVPFGELVSTIIINEYLNLIGIDSQWKDIRNTLKTDNTYRDAKVNWDLTGKLIYDEFSNFGSNIFITQGFIGADVNNLSTTLGREGSDFTAAILANVLNAERVVVWKDVPGILCADPDWIPNAEKIERLSYLDAIELSYFGAKVIHPKTIKPLQNKKIPLQVRSFIDVNEKGTIISDFNSMVIPPVYIKKEHQVLISIKPTDFSFIVEENLSHIFGILAHYQIKVNLMQNSAISFSISVNNDTDRVEKTILELKKHYEVKYNEPLELITIRHKIPGSEELVLKDRTILVEQKSRSVARYVVR